MSGGRVIEADVPLRCPGCDSAKVAKLVFGYPNERGRARARRGEIVFGGCRAWGDARDPKWACRACGLRWGEIIPLVVEPHGLGWE